MTGNLTTITEADLNALRAIEEKYNTLAARLDERHAQQMAWIETKFRQHCFIFMIVFLMIYTVFALHLEAKERRIRSWW